ncbi:hypothetical protein ACIRRA_35390 [Nocardia sp. NPDC101769]|uniref:Rv1733c family protein n=1 Tax=Nocardia sp. NPDC101769 TaxID=3364333 RepID=UPI0038011819
MRKGDRALSSAVLVAVVACLLAVPIALAVGAATYTSAAARLHARDDGKVAVTATVVTAPVYDSTHHHYTATVRWNVGDRMREAVAPVGNFVFPGAQARVWLAADGSPVSPPAPPGSAQLYAVGNGIGAVVVIVASAWIGVAVLRCRIEHRRTERLWQQYRALIWSMR